jgi:CheY-like chemotaxis protein
MNGILNKVLLIDDDEITIQLNKYIIEMTGIITNVEAALNGQKALDYLAEKEKAGAIDPELIFLDLNMPLMDGWEFMEEYSNFSEPFKASKVIVILSASPNPDDKQKAANTPYVNEFINKPLSVETALQLINKYSSPIIKAVAQ